MTLSLDLCLYLCAAGFSIGVYGVLSRQNIIVILMSLELMLNGVNLAIISFGRYFITPEGSALSGTGASSSQIFVIIVLAIAAAEAAVGLAILLAVYRRWRSARVSDMRLLKG